MCQINIYEVPGIILNNEKCHQSIAVATLLLCMGSYDSYACLKTLEGWEEPGFGVRSRATPACCRNFQRPMTNRHFLSTKNEGSEIVIRAPSTHYEYRVVLDYWFTEMIVSSRYVPTCTYVHRSTRHLCIVYASNDKIASDTRYIYK